MANKKTDFNSLKVGEYLSEAQYYKVIYKSDIEIEVENERGYKFFISKGIVEEGLHHALQHKVKKEVTRTELIHIFNNVGSTVFTVCFNKQPTADVINDAIESANKGKIIPIKDLKKLVKEAYKGEERILTGYLIANETGFGRSMVIDLALERGNNPDWDARTRQVDHRTLNWLICEGVFYTIKK